MFATSLLALSLLGVVQEPTFQTASTSRPELAARPLAPSPLDRVVAISLSSADPFLAGHGCCEWIDYVAEFSGTLHVWTKVEGALDTFVRVEDGDGKLLAEDDDSGGRSTPYVKLEVEPGAKLAIAVAASKTGETGEVELHIMAAPERGTTRSEAMRAKQELVEITRLRDAGDLSNARALAAALVERLARVEGGADSELVARQAWLAGVQTHAFALLRPTESAWRSALTHFSRTLPADHTELRNARLNLAVTIKNLGDLGGARALFEQVLEIASSTLSEDHFDVQRAQQGLALTLKAQGDLAGARVLEEALLEVRARTLPRDHADLQAARGNLAITIKALGDLAGARALEEEVLEVFSRTLPEEHRDLQAAREGLAITLYTLGDLAGASALFEQVLEVRSRTLPEDHPDLQQARLNFAATIKALGDVAGARVLEEALLEVRSRTLPEDHPDLQAARQNLAGTLYIFGDLAGARALLEKVVEVCSRTLPAEHPNLQKARQNLAATVQAQGDLAGARALKEAVLEARLRTLPEDHPDLQAARGNLAATLYTLGDLAGARALQEQVLEVSSRMLPEDHPDLQAARGNLAITIKDQGDCAGARALFEAVLEVRSRTLPEDHPDLQATRGGLAATMYELGEFAGAHALLETVLEVLSRTMPQDHPDLQMARGNLARTLYALGDLAGARTLQEQVLDVSSRTLPEDHSDLQVARRNLAFTLADEQTSVKDREEEGHGKGVGQGEAFASLAGDFIRSLARSAREALLSGSSREAEERCANLSKDVGLALSFAEGMGVFERDEKLEHQAFVSSESTRGMPLASASLVRRAASHPRYSELRDEVRSQSAELARLAQAGASTNEFDRVRSRRDAAERELVGLASDMSGAEPGALAVDLAALSAQLAENAAIVGYRRYRRFRPAENARQSSTDSLCAFVVRSGERLHRIELGPIEQVEGAVQAWRAAVGVRLERDVSAGSTTMPESLARGRDSARGIDVGFPSAADPSAAGKSLRQMVLDPLADSLGGTERIIVVLDDVLHLVPLAALPAGGAWTDDTASRDVDSLLVGDLVRIEVRTSLLELLEREPRPINGSLVVVGGVDYEGRDVPQGTRGSLATTASARGGVFPRGTTWAADFAPLEATVAEARGIAEWMQASRSSVDASLVDGRRVELLEGAHATCESLVALAPSARFLHVATHGWFAPESICSMLDPEPLDLKTGLGLRTGTEERVRGMAPMLLCGLALAGANLPENELGRAPGLMTAEEIATLDLSNCELAVLSACDTNVGERRAGQGVASLQRALHMAGARSVITSLWKVPDEATKELMLDFYRRIWILKEPKHAALWAAKKKLRDAMDERGVPKYTTRDWAAWVLTGQQN